MQSLRDNERPTLHVRPYFVQRTWAYCLRPVRRMQAYGRDADAYKNFTYCC